MMMASKFRVVRDTRLVLRSAAPPALVEYASRMIIGDAGNDCDGYSQLRTAALHNASDVADEIEALTRCEVCGKSREKEDASYLSHLNNAYDVYMCEAKIYKAEISTLLRLIDVEIMGEVFDLLREDFADHPHAWPLFITAASAAKLDFKKYRRLEKRAKKLAVRISNMAKGLAALLCELRETELNLPVELMQPYNDGCISLDGASDEVRYLKVWRAISNLPSKPTDKAESRPDLRVVLLQMSDATCDLRPDFMHPAIRAAMSTRQNSKKASYIRAFAAHLEISHIALTSAAKRAMAITGNVIFDDADMNISEDDVRKALKRQNHRSSSQSHNFLAGARKSHALRA